MARRTFLGGVAAMGAGGAVLATTGWAGAAARTAAKAAGTKPAGSDLGAVEHIVLLMQENRSFDHYFGVRKGVRGFGDHPKDRLGAFAQSWPGNTTHRPHGELLPFHLTTATEHAECTFDLSHDWPAQHLCWNRGKMDAFARTHTSSAFEGENGVLTMGYYTRADLPFYYALADAFTLCDGYHCSVLGPTDPNRLYWLSATLDPAGAHGGPIVSTWQDVAHQFSCSWTTMPEVLEDHGISWKVYNPPGNAYRPPGALSQLVSNNRLMYFRQYADTTSVLYQKAFMSSFPGDFARDVARGALPKVSWLVAPTIPADQTEHPPAPPARGEHYTHQVLQALAANPSVWSKTVLILSYDENDGFFDHVRPPTAPTGTAGEYLTASPLPSDAEGMSGPIGLGMRVPCMVISPFSRGGKVVSTVLDHTSQLRLIEERFGVPVPNLSKWRRHVTGDFTTTIGARGPASLPALPATPLTPTVVSEECTAGQELEQEDPSMPTPAVPTVQRMPAQDN